MNASEVKRLQSWLQERGLYAGSIDGAYGPQTQAALQVVLDAYDTARSAAEPVRLAWGAKVSQVFRDRILWAAEALKMPADGASWLMACIAWESNETFSPSVKNMAGSGAVGLIQFMPATAAGLGTSAAALTTMTAEDQINWVYRYFKPYAGRLNSLGDVYMAILWPAGIGQPNDYVLWRKSTRPTTYRQNAGLDINKDGAITKAEAVAKVEEKLTKGLQPLNSAPAIA